MNDSPQKPNTALDLGLQPVSNHFSKFESNNDDRFPLKIVWDNAKGLAKIESPFPRHAIRPVHPWLSYREPETHLDEVAREIRTQLSQQRTEGVAIALTYKDESLLKRLETLGLQSDRIDPMRDLKIVHDPFGLETIDEAISSGRLVRRFEPPAVFLLRHVLEHTVSPKAFLRGVIHSMKEDDLIFIETPECSDAIARCEYTLIWEEHNFYYTERSLKREIEEAGLEIIWHKTHQYPMEGSALFLAKKTSPKPGLRLADESSESDRESFRSYVDNFAPTKLAWGKALDSIAKLQSRIALFGAGHFACAFVHYFETASFISHCIDDRSQKQGKYLPGSKLPIVPTSTLFRPDPPEVCLLTVNPDSEDKVLEHLASYLEQGGKAFSIFQNSPRYLIK